MADLLDVAEPGHELLAGNALPVLVLVPLPDQPGQYGQEVKRKFRSG